MLKRAFISVAVLCLALTAGAAAQSVVPDSNARDRAAKPDSSIASSPTRRKPKPPSTCTSASNTSRPARIPAIPAPPAIKILRVVPSGNGHVPDSRRRRWQAKDSAAYRADLESLARALAQLVNDAGSQRDALEKYAKKKKDRNDLIDATHNAFLFTFAGLRTARRPHAFQIQNGAKPGLQNPPHGFSAIFPKVRGFVWVDEASGELARVEGNVMEDISVGLFLEKSTRAATSCRSATNFSLGCGSQASRIRFRRPQIVFELLRP